ncbi:MAG: hypothetical protein AAFQ19_04845 [Pseudomonadota bacterium]
MSTREDGPSEQPSPDVLADTRSSSNIKMLVIAAAFLMVTIGLIAMQPGADEAPAADVAVVQPQSDPTVAQDDLATEVSRADASLLQLDQLSASEAVSRQLRQPIRLTDTDASRHDLRSLTAAVLADFGHAVSAGDRLHALLVQALTEGQSNAYIDALLNTAAARGEFVAPTQLQTSAGRLDTETLLRALVLYARG